MSFMGGILGSTSGNSGHAGLNYRADYAPIVRAGGTNAPQLNQAYNDSKEGMDEQIRLMDALRRQNGIGSQSNVFNQQQALANQLQGIAGGYGPNPALQQ